MIELTLTISREQIVGSESGKIWLRAPALLTLTPGKGRPLVAAVGESEAEFFERVRRPLADANLPLPRPIHPGEDPWWDLAWRWPMPTIEEARSSPAPADDESVFFLSPLRRETWAPHLAEAMFHYHLQRHGRGRLLKPRVVLRRADDFDEIEWAEIHDAVSGFRVTCDPPVPPLPVTRAARRKRLASAGMLIIVPAALLLCVLLARYVAQESRTFLSAALALLCVGVMGLHSRMEKATEREAPRRQQPPA